MSKFELDIDTNLLVRKVVWATFDCYYCVKLSHLGICSIC